MVIKRALKLEILNVTFEIRNYELGLLFHPYWPMLCACQEDGI